MGGGGALQKTAERSGEFVQKRQSFASLHFSMGSFSCFLVFLAFLHLDNHTGFWLDQIAFHKGSLDLFLLKGVWGQVLFLFHMFMKDMTKSYLMTKIQQ